MLIAIRNMEIAFNTHGPSYGIGCNDVGVNAQDCLTPYGLFLPVTAEDMPILNRLKQYARVDFAAEGPVSSGVRLNGQGIIIDEDGLITKVQEVGKLGKSNLVFTPISVRGVTTLIEERHGFPMECTAMRMCVHLTNTLEEQLKMYAKYHALPLHYYPVQTVGDVVKWIRDRFEIVSNQRLEFAKQLRYRVEVCSDTRKFPPAWAYDVEGQAISAIMKHTVEIEKTLNKRKTQ